MVRSFLPAAAGALGLLATSASVHVSAAPASSTVSGLSGARCAQLVGKRIAGATVEKADFVLGGTSLGLFGLKMPADACRVDARISPVAGSEVKMQVWLPTDWNGKFVGVGGGGFEGSYSIAPVVLRRPVSEGYAGVVTNAGHDLNVLSPDPKWALESPEKIVDYGNRANHLGAVVGKALVAEYYGSPAKRTYFHGCSNGGRDALILAQRYPTDYDAIAAGAPANDFTGLATSFVRIGQLKSMAGVDLSKPKMKLVYDASIKKCDPIDGVSDGLIERPAMCKFDPAVLECKSSERENCLSKAEVRVLRELYRGSYAHNGRQVMPGLPVGSEYEWANWLTGSEAAGLKLGIPFYRYMVYKDPSWDIAKFNIDSDYLFARKQLGPVLDAVDPDLRPFLRKGGKLLMYHGWDDAAIPAGNTLKYHAAMTRATGRLAQDRTRLFMLPGVAHCADGNGPDTINYLAELDRWTESGVAPDRMVATKYDSKVAYMAGLPTKVVRTRPVCAWPKSAHYGGTGSTDDAANFVCR